MFKQLCRSVALLGLAGGWTLSAASLYVVRTPGHSLPVLVTKDHLGFKDTYVDTRNWTAGDDAAHPQLVARLIQAGRCDLLSHTVCSHGGSVEAQLASAMQNATPTPAGPGLEDKAKAALKTVTDAVKAKLN